MSVTIKDWQQKLKTFAEIEPGKTVYLCGSTSYRRDEDFWRVRIGDGWSTGTSANDPVWAAANSPEHILTPIEPTALVPVGDLPQFTVFEDKKGRWMLGLDDGQELISCRLCVRPGGAISRVIKKSTLVRPICTIDIGGGR